MQKFKQAIIKANGLEFFFVEQGEGPLVLCMHGFPDTNRTYRFLLPTLAQAGYHAVAPNLRGYWPTSFPKDNVYQTAALAQDVLELIDAFHEEEAILVGHDWGADAVLGAAQLSPDKIKKVIAMAEYYGKTATELAETNPAEIERSYYMKEFLQDNAVEKFRQHDFAYLRRLWRDWSPQYNCPVDEKEHIINTFRQPGVTNAALAYDKAALDPHYKKIELATAQHLMDNNPIPVPALILYGEKDGCHGKKIIEAMPQQLLPLGRKQMINNAGHFLHLEQPDKINEIILKFISQE